MASPAQDRPEYFVLSNQTATAFDIAGWRISAGVHFTFPEFISAAPRESFLAGGEAIVLSGASAAETRAAYPFPPSQRILGPWSGKLDSEGERLTIQDKNGATIATAKYGNTSQRLPSAPGRGHPLLLIDVNGRCDDPQNWTGGTPEAANGQAPCADIVINEIMFDPSPIQAAAEYIELYNRGSNTIDMAGWRLVDAVDYQMPAGTQLGPGSFLVLTSQAASMKKIYPGIAILGDYQGKLSSKGETVRLVDRDGLVADEIRYGAGGAWPELAKGGGSSLELVNPWQERTRPSAWQASLEHAGFRAFSVTNVYRQLRDLKSPSDDHELQLFLVDDGHVALKNLGLWKDGTNFIPHLTQSTNGSGAGGWLCQGTHAGSYFTNGELHLVADGGGDNLGNGVEIDLPDICPGQSYELRFEGRWISGEPRLIAQTWDGSISGSFLMDLPRAPGTPGRINSTSRPTVLPQLDELQHSPAVPKAGEQVQISVIAAGPLQKLEVVHRLDSREGTNAWASTPMSANKSGSRGHYEAFLRDYKKAGQLVQFYVRAVNPDATEVRRPNDGPMAPALFVIDGKTVPTDLRTVRILVSARDIDALAHGDTARHGYRYPRLSNHDFNATIIHDETRVTYGAEVRDSGSPITRNGLLRKPKVKLPADRPFRGLTKFVYDDDAESALAYHNRVARYLLYLLGQSANHSEFVRVAINQGEFKLRDETEPVDNDFLQRVFPRGDEGDLYKIDDEWFLADSGEGPQRDADWNYRGDDAALYRRTWSRRNHETRDDYGPLIALFRLLSTTNYTQGEIENMLDTEAMLSVVAVRGFIGDWDNFIMQRGRNGYFYRAAQDGRFRLLHWDSDEAFVKGQPLYGRFVKDWVEQAWNRPRFSSAVEQLLRVTTDDPVRLRTWLDVQRASAPQDIKMASYLPFFQARSAEVRTLLTRLGKELLAAENVAPAER